MKNLKNTLILIVLIISFGCRKSNDQAPVKDEINKEDRLEKGPRSPGPHGPFSASDFNRDGTVTKAEIDEFIADGPERKYGLLAYLEMYDKNNDGQLTNEELALVEPSFAFDGTDSDGNGIVTKAEVEDYVSERLYRQMGLDEFFDLIDTDNNNEVSPEEIETAHVKGQLPRG